MKRSFGLLLGFAFGAMALTSSARAEVDRFKEGEEVPVFSLKAINGDELGEAYISIDKYFGKTAKDPKKATVISFFATHCKPCKEEMPLLAALYDAYKDKGLQVVLVSIDRESDQVEVAKGLAKTAGVKFPVLTDRYNIVAKRYYVAALPNLYLVNRDGKVVLVNIGYSDDISRKLVDEIRKAIGEPTSAPLPEAVAKQMGRAGSAVETVPVATDAPAGSTPPDTSSLTAPQQPVTATAAAAEAQPDDNSKAKGKAKKAKGKAKGKKK